MEERWLTCGGIEYRQVYCATHQQWWTPDVEMVCPGCEDDLYQEHDLELRK